jgi:hypothetical protein
VAELVPRIYESFEVKPFDRSDCETGFQFPLDISATDQVVRKGDVAKSMAGDFMLRPCTHNLERFWTKPALQAVSFEILNGSSFAGISRPIAKVKYAPGKFPKVTTATLSKSSLMPMVSA